jgi:hypothetical protein
VAQPFHKQEERGTEGVSLYGDVTKDTQRIARVIIKEQLIIVEKYLWDNSVSVLNIAEKSKAQGQTLHTHTPTEAAVTDIVRLCWIGLN